MTLQELLDYYNLTIINKPDKIRTYTKFELESSDGYKYYLSKDNLVCARRREAELCKYFRNPYTEHNLSNFLMIVTNGDVILKDFQNAQNAHDPILLHCNSIDLDYVKSANEITSGRYYLKTKMPDYHGSNYKDIDQIKEEGKLYNVEIVSDTIINNTSPLKFICNKHREMGVQEKSWVGISQQKYPCKYCYDEFLESRKSPKTQRKIKLSDGSNNYEIKSFKEKFMDDAARLRNPFVDVVGEYKSAHEKIECKCLKCGETFYLRPDHIKRGIGHSGCNKSLGEERLEKYLKEHSINYIGQYRFGDCIRKERDMPFDFYLPDLNIAIEYDGIQHYEPVVKFGGEEGFAELKLNDYFKTNYCIEHNIKLIRVPYTEYDSMEEFLNNYFNKE
nr:MAG TPA: restriction enzyme [Caudoviricetes sp.]